ncbi:DUF535 family protein [Opitutus sp. GAS368]|uniref:DUF535 family protein n=1 Tax=Opitutus sp. GAS368 TaxID=1882749 RepID=UPI00087AEAE4|nr:DUF535 family protein [Opitutus sp. GAS368]SDS53931.1 Uncharacterized protein VirK/YbjX [Opitutus sp. GAS368]
MTPPYLRSLFRVARTVYPEPTWAHRGQRLLFVFRLLRNHPHSRRWLEYLATERMAPLAAANPSLYRKPIRPYVSTHWPGRMKVAAMMHHYDFLARRLPPPAFRQVVSREGLRWLAFPARNGDHLAVILRFDGKFRKEGETTLDLESTRYGCRIASMTFVVAASTTGAPCLIIGAVSGLPPGADKDIIKDTAKALFGLRPKVLLLLLLQELARSWNVPVLLGAGNRIHTSRDMDYWLNHTRRFPITYDSFWEEAGGHRRSDGFFVLPLQPSPRNFHDIPPQKRAHYRHRYALIDGILERFRAGPEPAPTDPAAAARTDGEPAASRGTRGALPTSLAGLVLCGLTALHGYRSLGHSTFSVPLDVLPEHTIRIQIRAYDDPTPSPPPAGRSRP